MSKWKYVDETCRAVYRTDNNGKIESYLVSVIADWIAEGNTPGAADPLPIDEIVVSPWQIRKALNALELRDSVEAGVATGDQSTKDAWQYATEFREFDQLVMALGAALGKTPEEMHALFQLAESL